VVRGKDTGGGEEEGGAASEELPEE